MTNKKIRRLYAKLIILVLCFFIITRIFILVLAKYESISNSYANVDIALYLLDEDYKEMTLNLGTLLPRNEAYLYEFAIGNQKDDKRAELDIEYELSLRATTNLPLNYELYMNEKYDDIGAKNIITENNVEFDDFGTYFRTMKTDKVTLPYTKGVTNVYQLVVYFPAGYDKEMYQDIIELVEINVNGVQVTGE